MQVCRRGSELTRSLLAKGWPVCVTPMVEILLLGSKTIIWPDLPPRAAETLKPTVVIFEDRKLIYSSFSVAGSLGSMLTYK